MCVAIRARTSWKAPEVVSQSQTDAALQRTARAGRVRGGSHALPDSEFGSTPMPSPCRTTEDKPSMTQRETSVIIFDRAGWHGGSAGRR